MIASCYKLDTLVYEPRFMPAKIESSPSPNEPLSKTDRAKKRIHVEVRTTASNARNLTILSTLDRTQLVIRSDLSRVAASQGADTRRMANLRKMPLESTRF